MKIKTWILVLFGALILGFCGFWSLKKVNLNAKYSVGQKLDSLHGVYVFYNGGVGHVSGRNTTKDGYNLGMKYQCVEFVKRYYYEYLNHKMPDSYGHAKDFFDAVLADGELNKRRNLIQYTNPSNTKPEENDIIVFNKTLLNRFGHIAIISSISEDKIEIIQQNSGPFGETRKTFPLVHKNGKWIIQNDRVLGWLRKDFYNKSDKL